MTLTPAELAERVLELDAKATPGPWKFGRTSSDRIMERDQPPRMSAMTPEDVR